MPKPEQAGAPNAPVKKNVLDVFLSGSKKGVNLWFNNMIPSVAIAGLLVTLIDVTGLQDLLGTIFSPLMSIVGLPGEAAVLWVASFMTMSVAIIGALPLLAEGVLTAQHAAILLAMIMATTAPAKIIRMASAADVDNKTMYICYGLTFVCSFLCGIVMRFVIMLV